MVLRMNRREGNYFWGCRRYPACRGTRDIGSDSGTPRSKTQPNRPLRSESYGTMPRWTEMGGSADTRQLVEDSALPLLSWVSRTNFANAGWRAPRQLSPVYGRRSSRRSHGPSSWPSRSGQRAAAIHRHADSLLVEQVGRGPARPPGPAAPSCDACSAARACPPAPHGFGVRMQAAVQLHPREL